MYAEKSFIHEATYTPCVYDENLLHEWLESLRENLRNSCTAWGLDRCEVLSINDISIVNVLTKTFKDTHVTPPWASSPPGSTNPNAGLLHSTKSTLNSRDTGRVGAGTDLTQESLEVVVLEPLSGSLDTLSTDCGRDASRRSSGTVRVEILVHF